MSDLGNMEDEIFKKRQQNELAWKGRERDKRRRLENSSNDKMRWIPTGQFAPQVYICFEKKIFLYIQSNELYIENRKYLQTNRECSS